MAREISLSFLLRQIFAANSSGDSEGPGEQADGLEDTSNFSATAVIAANLSNDSDSEEPGAKSIDSRPGMSSEQAYCTEKTSKIFPVVDGAANGARLIDSGPTLSSELSSWPEGILALSPTADIAANRSLDSKEPGARLIEPGLSPAVDNGPEGTASLSPTANSGEGRNSHPQDESFYGSRLNHVRGIKGVEICSDLCSVGGATCVYV